MIHRAISFLSFLFISSVTFAQSNLQTAINNVSWSVVTDQVMGGKSNATITKTDTSLLFNGTISTENNGGFIALKSSAGVYDFTNTSTIALEYTASASADFVFTLEPSPQWFDTYYRCPIAVTSDTTGLVTIADCSGFRIGNATNQKLQNYDLAKINQFGFVNTQKPKTPVQLELKSIKVQ